MTLFARGCGDPNCSSCGKTGGSGIHGLDIGSVSFEFPPAGTGSRGNLEELRRHVIAQLVGALGVPPDMQLAGALGVPLHILKQATNEAAAPVSDGPSAEEQALRGRVEKYFLKTGHQTAWDDVIGNDDARAALVEAIEHPVTQKDLYAFYGLKPAKGVLLYGPPGCGKSLFGKAAAAAMARLHGNDDVPLLKINGPEIQSAYVGKTEETIRDVFAYARIFAKRTGRRLVIFIDEADAILPARDGSNGRRTLPWEENQVATFLTEMDGLEDSGAFVILATNRPHAIDAALLRDGRCDRKIKVKRPDEAAANKILFKALLTVPNMEPAVATEYAARATEVFFDPSWKIATIVHSNGTDFLTLGGIVNGAMLEGLVEQAKAAAFRRDLASGDRSGLGVADLEAAIASIFEQNRHLNHFAAIEDMAETFNFSVDGIKPQKAKANAMH